MTTRLMSKPKRLNEKQIEVLKSAGCFASDWSKVSIHPDSDLTLIRNVEFEGEVEIGCINRSLYPKSIISNAILKDCKISDGCRIRNIGGGLINIKVGKGVIIENTFKIENERGSACGIGTRVTVLDETGSREVILYPGLNAQEAMLMARARRSEAEHIYNRTSVFINKLIEEIEAETSFDISDYSEISNAGFLTNIHLAGPVKIEGANALRNGTITSSAENIKESLTYIGSAVDAENFIIDDGCVDSGAILRNCYVGQGVKIEKGFTAHDSLFFANSIMENGEACALFAGPYTVSMHKGTLLIGCQTSFMNAGSSTNQSNHMYKLGPVHWGVLERGVKTSSGSYLMLGAYIGAFSLLMGSHKTHPDSREFPFSYLFGDPQGATVVVPAVMLRSCGLMRDENKWPARDRRLSLPVSKRNDRITFPILNPVTVESMIKALEIIRPMLSKPADDDRYHRYKGMKLSRASLERALKLYYVAVLKYLAMVFFPQYQEIGFTHPSEEKWKFPAQPENEAQLEFDSERWIDLGGQVMRFHTYTDAVEAKSVEEADNIMSEAFKNYEEEQLRWIAARFPKNLRLDAAEIIRGAKEFDRLVEIDRENYRESLSAEQGMLRLS